MNRPVVRPYTDPAGGQWFVTSGRFPTEAMGAVAYKALMANLERGDLGVYRHGEPGEGGVLVTAVSPARPEVLRVSRLLGSQGGADECLHDRMIQSMVVRRARVVVEHQRQKGPAGRLKITHAGRGAYLSPDGVMSDDLPQGQG